MHEFRLAVLMIAMVLTASCAPGAPSSPASPASQAGSASQVSAPTAPRVLTLSIAREPTFIAALAPLPSQQASDFYVRAFNAFLDLYDGDGRPVPYMAEALPALNTESWQVFPDGRMETRYLLKPNQVWHDGAPLTA